MSSEKEQSKIFPTKYNNKEINVTTAGTVLTFNFVDATADTATIKYFNLGRPAYAVQIRFSVASDATIDTINGTDLDYPISINEAGAIFKSIEWRSIIVTVQTASTVIKVYAQ